MPGLIETFFWCHKTGKCKNKYIQPKGQNYLLVATTWRSNLFVLLLGGLGSQTFQIHMKPPLVKSIGRRIGTRFRMPRPEGFILAGKEPGLSYIWCFCFCCCMMMFDYICDLEPCLFMQQMNNKCNPKMQSMCWRGWSLQKSDLSLWTNLKRLNANKSQW